MQPKYRQAPMSSSNSTIFALLHTKTKIKTKEVNKTLKQRERKKKKIK
jgi:hypothetical protein